MKFVELFWAGYGYEYHSSALSVRRAPLDSLTSNRALWSFHSVTLTFLRLKASADYLVKSSRGVKER